MKSPLRFVAAATLFILSNPGASARVSCLPELNICCIGQNTSADDAFRHPEACSEIRTGTITFEDGSADISAPMRERLATLAEDMRSNPTCKVVVTGNGGGSKFTEQKSWDRVDAVITHMSENNGINRNRFIFRYNGEGIKNNLDFRPAREGEDGPSQVAPPAPNLRR